MKTTTVTYSLEETSVMFVENHIQIWCQMKSKYDAQNARIGLIKNASTQVFIMFILIVTLMTICRDTVAYK